MKTPPHAYGNEVCRWEPGINLVTFLMYDGAYPTRKEIKIALKTLKNRIHNDWTVNNMILQGKKLKLVDWNDPVHDLARGRRYSRKLFKAHLHLLDLKDPKEIENYFWKKLIANY